MSKVFLLASFSVLLAVGLMLTGCSTQQASQEPSASPDAPQDEPAAVPHQGHEGHEHEGHEGHAHEGSGHAGHQHGEEPADQAGAAAETAQGEHGEALSKLSPDDQALAEEQKICPVSGQPLGSMGKPYKVTVNGRGVLLCCQGCEAKIKENPEEYLAKLPE